MESKGSIYEGKTLDDAVRKGLEALGLSRAEVMITVVEEGSGGFLGLGARPYRVRVMPRPGGAVRESDARGGRGERGRSSRGGRGPERRGSERGGRDPRRARPTADAAGRGYAGAGGTARHDGPREERRDPRRPRPTPDAVGREYPPGGAPERPEARAEDRPPRDDRHHGERRPESFPPANEESDERRRRRRGRRGGRGRGPSRLGSEASFEGAGSALAENRPAREPGDRERSRPPRGEFGGRERAGSATAEGPGFSAEELTQQGLRFTSDLLKAMGFEARITAKAEGSRVDVTAEVQDDEELLTGRKGEVRQALQHLLNRMLNRGEGSRYHLQLEINDFWQRRENDLRDLAQTLAEEAVTSGGERLTEYLNAQERRIIHVTLKEDARVKTYAIGDGLIKKVAVAPADYPEGPRDEG